MTDLEIIKLCAGAVGAKLDAGHEYYWLGGRTFRPFLDDGQCFAMVKLLGLNIQHNYWDDPVVSKHDAHGKLLAEARNTDINRAVCECAAKLQATRQTTDQASPDAAAPERAETQSNRDSKG